jgi:hypothetical protein
MGWRPTHRNESHACVTPAKAGVHFREELDSRFRGNDVTLDGAFQDAMGYDFRRVAEGIEILNRWKRSHAGTFSRVHLAGA